MRFGASTPPRVDGAVEMVKWRQSVEAVEEVDDEIRVDRKAWGESDEWL